MEQKDELKPYLELRLEEHKQANPVDNASLLGALLEWGAAVPSRGTLYESMSSQIAFQAQRKNLSKKEFVDYLFRQPDYEAWMLAFQL
ncbi:MAG: hypothetical protein V1725_00370 [archaeon]